MLIGWKVGRFQGKRMGEGFRGLGLYRQRGFLGRDTIMVQREIETKHSVKYAPLLILEYCIFFCYF